MIVGLWHGDHVVVTNVYGRSELSKGACSADMKRRFGRRSGQGLVREREWFARSIISLSQFSCLNRKENAVYCTVVYRSKCSTVQSPFRIHQNVPNDLTIRRNSQTLHHFSISSSPAPRVHHQRTRQFRLPLHPPAGPEMLSCTCPRWREDR